jgi:hypothetical protein
MRFWFDTEFMEDGVTIELLSIGIVAQDGREYYAVSADADWSRANDWVAKNVLPQLDRAGAKSRAQIRHELLRFIGHAEYDQHAGTKRGPELWAWFGSYDWVVLCQLFGRMVDLPDGWPMYVRDVKQLCDDLGNPKLPPQVKGAHHALADAQWTRKAWEFLEQLRHGPIS